MSGLSTRSPAPAAAGWLYGPVPDLVLGCGLGSMAVMASLAVWGASVSAVIPGSLLVLLFALPHYGATLLRVYELPEDRHRYSLFAIWFTLAIAGSFVLGLRDAFMGSLILTLYLTWSPWHYSGQNYGVLLIVLARRGVGVDKTTKRLVYTSFILSYALAFLAIHGVERTAAYAPVSYAGTIFRLIPLGLPDAVSTPLVYATAIAYLASLIGAVVLLLRRGSLSQIAPGLVVFGTQALWFSVPVLIRFWGMESARQAVSGIYSAYGFVWIAAAHSVQYLWITTYYATSSRDRPAASADPSSPTTSTNPSSPTTSTNPSSPSNRLRYLVSAAFAGFAIWTIPVLIFAPGVLGELPHESGLALLVAATVNLHHFVLDGVVWKLRDGRVAQILLKRADSRAATTAGLVPQRGKSWASRGVWATGALCVALGLFALWEEDVGFRRSLAAGDTIRARTAVERLASMGRDGPKRRTQLGRELAKRKQYRAARSQFQRALGLHPTADGWKAMALLHEEGQAWKLAAQAYGAAAALDPNDPTIRYKMGLSWLQASDPASAVAAFEAALALAPEEKLIQLSLARARREADLQADRSARPDGEKALVPADRPAAGDGGEP